MTLFDFPHLESTGPLFVFLTQQLLQDCVFIGLAVWKHYLIWFSCLRMILTTSRKLGTAAPASV